MLGCEALALCPPTLPLPCQTGMNDCVIFELKGSQGFCLCLTVNAGLFHLRAASSVSSAARARSWVRHTRQAQTHSCRSCQRELLPKRTWRRSSNARNGRESASLRVLTCSPPHVLCISRCSWLPPPTQLMIPSSCSGLRVFVYTYKTHQPFTPHITNTHRGVVVYTVGYED